MFFSVYLDHKVHFNFSFSFLWAFTMNQTVKIHNDIIEMLVFVDAQEGEVELKGLFGGLEVVQNPRVINAFTLTWKKKKEQMLIFTYHRFDDNN